MRGHVFADHKNETIIVAIKGTSFSLFGDAYSTTGRIDNAYVRPHLLPILASNSRCSFGPGQLALFLLLQSRGVVLDARLRLLHWPIYLFAGLHRGGRHGIVDLLHHRNCQCSPLPSLLLQAHESR